jgi:uncharacterized membrane protein
MNAPDSGHDQKLEEMIGWLLRIGVILSALVVLAGGAIYLSRHAGTRVERHPFEEEPAKYSHPGDILRAAGQFQGRAIIQLGLLLLIATPVARVAFCLLAFLRRRDLFYAGLALFVLAVLLTGLLTGIGER